jgi:hypothetical protein
MLNAVKITLLVLSPIPFGAFCGDVAEIHIRQGDTGLGLMVGLFFGIGLAAATLLIGGLISAVLNAIGKAPKTPIVAFLIPAILSWLAIIVWVFSQA